ncbi:IclR family transcriptional regulator [Rhodococcus globerulus]|uniref:IclR family transcriptional regulator n=1 Tax=Rhodococcus globerulus TaxID=33008 RepID=UPI00374EBD3A
MRYPLRTAHRGIDWSRIQQGDTVLEEILVQALDRLMQVLEIVAAAPTPISAAEIASTARLPLSTIARLTNSMTQAGLLHRSPTDRKFTLGVRIFALSRPTRWAADLPTIARPALEYLRDLTGESTGVHVRRGTESLCVAYAASRHPIRHVLTLGSTTGLATSAIGRTLMSAVPEATQGEYLTDLGLSPTQCHEELEQMKLGRERRWLISDDELTGGLTTLAAGFYVDNKAFGCLSISGPTHRFTLDTATDFIGAAIQAADEIVRQVALSHLSAEPADHRGI